MYAMAQAAKYLQCITRAAAQKLLALRLRSLQASSAAPVAAPTCTWTALFGNTKLKQLSETQAVSHTMTGATEFWWAAIELGVGVGTGDVIREKLRHTKFLHKQSHQSKVVILK